MNKKRRFFSPTDKVMIIKRHLVDRTPVSDLCDEYDLHPNQVYQWQKQFFERGAAALQLKRTGTSRNGLDAFIRMSMVDFFGNTWLR